MPKHILAWTDKDRTTLRTMLVSGAPVIDVARRLRISPTLVYSAAERFYGGVGVLRAGVRTLNQITRLMSVRPEVAYTWITTGLLATTRNKAIQPSVDRTGRRPRNQYLITDAALLAFLRNRSAWMSWDVAAITDEAWRLRARQIRLAVNGSWLCVKDVAARTCYGLDTVCHWLRTGRLPGVKWMGHWYVWSEDLIGWRPPEQTIDYAERARRRAATEQQRRAAP